LQCQARGASALGELVEGLPVETRVLVIGAHPDDEDTRLIAWLTKGHHMDVAYLSLTRGDGGQNLIGNELGEALGVIRTEELLAARRIDGAHQYFTRAYDFGFSKSAAETFQHWPHDSVLTDVVTVVRAFRPQVIVSVFSGTPRDGHGHHQVAGIVSKEAYDVAADTVRFPRAATAGFGAWTPLKFYRTRSYWQGQGATFFYDAGAYSPLLGESYAEIAAQSRSQHKSQGFGMVQRKGYIAGSLAREASRVNAPANAKQEQSPFDGIDTTWNRLSAEVTTADERADVQAALAASRDAQHTLDLYKPETGLGALERMRAALADLALREAAGGSPNIDVVTSVQDGLQRVTRAILLARGIAIEADVDRDEVAQGDSVPVKVTVYNRGTLPVSADLGPRLAADPEILPDSSLSMTIYEHGGALTEPWWLTEPRAGDMFTVPVNGESDDERDAELRVPVSLDSGTLVTQVPIVHEYGDPVLGDVRRPLMVVPPVAVTLDDNVEIARAGEPLTRTVRVHLRSALTAPRTVTVSLDLPRGLRADSASRTVTLGQGGAATVTFAVRGALAAGAHEISAVAKSGGATYTTGSVSIEYPHIRPRKLYHDASMSVHAIDVALPAKLNVAYIPGVGDNVAPMLPQLGIPLTVLDPAKLSSTDLSRFTTIVVGPRAYEANPTLGAMNARLFDWVKRGGTMVV
ncbi:MAG: PIG-L family deacetylase, partial [Gemmatimonadaceae bacterium]